MTRANRSGWTLHPETERALRIIIEIEAEISINREKLRKLKRECPHHDSEARYEETMAFEHQPMLVCVVCGVRGGAASEEQSRDLWRKWCDNMDRPFNEEEFQSIKFGFSL